MQTNVHTHARSLGKMPSNSANKAFLTPSNNFTEATKRIFNNLSPEQRRTLAKELHGEADPDNAAADYGKAMIQAMSVNQMHQDLRGTIPLLKDVSVISSLMVFVQMCGAQARDGDYKPAMVAAMTRSNRTEIHNRCAAYVENSVAVTKDDWRTLVRAFLEDTHTRRFLQTARGDWCAMAKSSVETTGDYATRAERDFSGYDYVSRLVDGYREDDQHVFVHHWINGLDESVRSLVLLSVDSDSATMLQARRAAQRLESSSKDSRRNGEAASLKRKMEALEEKLEKATRRKRDSDPTDFIAMLAPILHRQQETMMSAFRASAPKVEPRWATRPAPPSYPPPGRDSGGAAIPAQGRKNYCREFNRLGSCSRGASCKFSHDCPPGACWVCGAVGHKSWECPMAPPCPLCGQKGHSKRFCPNQKKV
jgi:hypothetical protein